MLMELRLFTNNKKCALIKYERWYTRFIIYLNFKKGKYTMENNSNFKPNSEYENKGYVK